MLMSHRIKKLSVKFNSSHLRALTLFHHLSESCTRRENVDEKNHSILRINGNDVDVTIESNMKFMIHSMSITNFPRSLWSLINSNKTLNTSSIALIVFRPTLIVEIIFALMPNIEPMYFCSVYISPISF